MATTGAERARNQRFSRKIAATQIWDPKKRRKLVSRILHLAGEAVLDGDLDHSRTALDAARYLDNTDPHEKPDENTVREAFDKQHQGWLDDGRHGEDEA